MLDPSLDIIDMHFLWNKKSTIHRLRSSVTYFEDGQRDLWKYLVFLSWKWKHIFFLIFQSPIRDLQWAMGMGIDNS